MQTFLVGGAVRDRLLSLPVQEQDWVVVGSTTEEMLEQGFRQVGRDFPVFLHPQTHEEYALARTERKSGHGHTGFTVFSNPEVTLEEDLSRRDLTINAIAQDKDGKLIDPYNGQKDIQNRVLRHISPAFSEDPLRVLRVARFAAKFWSIGFTIAPETLALMSSICDSGELEQLSTDRIWQETQRGLATAHPEIYILVLMQTGALEKISPSLAKALQRKSALLNLSSIKSITNHECRYVCLVLLASESNHEFDAEIAKQINNSFISCGDLYEFVLLVVKHFKSCCQASTTNSEQIYNLLHSLDAYRRQSRCQRIIECMHSAQIIFQHCSKHSLALLANLIPILNMIKIGEVQRAGLEGKEIGKKLKELRIKAIDNELQNI